MIDADACYLLPFFVESQPVLSLGPNRIGTYGTVAIEKTFFFPRKAKLSNPQSLTVTKSVLSFV